MSHGSTAASTSPRVGGRQAPVCHVASLRQPATRALPATNKQNAGQAFVWMDRYLDSGRVGPLYLKQQPIAQLVVDSIRYGAQHLQYYDLQELSSWRTLCTC